MVAYSVFLFEVVFLLRRLLCCPRELVVGIEWVIQLRRAKIAQ